MIEADNINEDYLYELLAGQINAKLMFHNWKIEGLLPLILKYIDIDHKP